MNKFSFKLEPLFEYRQRLEEICRKEFGEALKRLADEESKLSALRVEHRRSSEECDRIKEAGAQANEVGLYHDYLVGLKLHIDEQHRVICTVREAFEAKREGLLQASKEKKVMEKMKERSFSVYNEALNKEEQKTSDELANRFRKGGFDEEA